MTVFTATWRDEIGCEYRKDLVIRATEGMWDAALHAAMEFQTNYLEAITSDLHPRLIALEGDKIWD